LEDAKVKFDIIGQTVPETEESETNETNPDSDNSGDE